MTFRNDIQMLRGLSVLFVVLFHLEVGGFSSGFLGVDVFFVISGFLMAKLYNSQDMVEFFKKRARRLLPAYFAVIFLTVFASLLMIVPSDFLQVQKQAFYALGFSSNFGFWSQNSYFAKGDFNPLLHLWSLGVELQFYLLVPLIYWLTNKSKSYFYLLMLLSAMTCFLVAGVSPKTSFFLTPFRLWEFLIGYGIAKYVQHSGSVPSRKFIGTIGLVAVLLIPFAKVNGESLSFLNGHPGFAALIIACASGMVLAFGIHEQIERNLVSRGLVRLGEYSYSIYLAHFPVIVLFHYRPFVGTRLDTGDDAVDKLFLLVLIWLASWILYKLVETPFRKSVASSRAFSFSLITVVAIVISFAVSGQINQARYTDKERNVFNAWTDRVEFRCGKLFRIRHPFLKICNLTELGEPSRRIMLVGDSHADSIKAVFSEEARKKNIDVYFSVSRDPLANSEAGVEKLIAEAKKLKIDNFVMHFRTESIEIKVLDNFVKKARIAGISVSYILPVPTWDDLVPALLYDHLANGTPLPDKSIESYRAENEELLSFIENNHSVSLMGYPVAEYFCDAYQCLMSDSKFKPYYFDGHHLTITGSRKLQPVFLKVLNELPD